MIDRLHESLTSDRGTSVRFVGDHEIPLGLINDVGPFFVSIPGRHLRSAHAAVNMESGRERRSNAPCTGDEGGFIALILRNYGTE